MMRSYPRAFFVLIAIGAALLFVGILIELPIYKQVCDEAANGAKRNCEFEHIGLFAIRKIVEALSDGNFVTGLVTALATAAIAYFTLTIRNINRSELEHSHRVERAYVSGGGVPTMRQMNIRTAEGDLLPGVNLYVVDLASRTLEATGEFSMQINNHGKTTAEILEYGYGWCEADNLPERPRYEWVPHRDWTGPGTQSRPFATIPVPKIKLSRPAIYGRFRYRDIFGAPHSDGFIQERDKPLLAPRCYTESDPPWDISEVGKRKY